MEVFFMYDHKHPVRWAELSPEKKTEAVDAIKAEIEKLIYK